MRRTLFFFLLLLPSLSLRALAINEDSPTFSTGPVPAWIKPCDFSLKPIPAKASQVNVQYLLEDTQYNWPQKAIYLHTVCKPLSQLGVSDAGQIHISFAPSYEKVIVHMIRVFRDGKWTDRLQRSRHALLHREPLLESELYEGDFTLVYFLEDIRIGDIVEYAFSIEGELSYFSSHLNTIFAMQGRTEYERLYLRLLAGNDVNFKLFNTSVQPEITDLSKKLREWSWEMEETAPIEFEEDTPSWHRPFSWVEFSQYKTWSDVIGKMQPLWNLQSSLDDVKDEELLSLVQSWMNASSNPAERAFCALRFVQDEVRYLGFEEGIDGLKPHDPLDVFKSRYGDCKDKTFLLHALLKWMGIESTPVLVNVDLGKILPDFIPLAFAFDHVILRIDIGRKQYFVDSTIYLQGGSSLKESFCPIYYWGLPLSRSETGLVRIPGNFDNKPTQVDNSIVIESDEFATMTIVRTFHGFKADYIRRYFNAIGVENYAADFRDSLQRIFGQAELSCPVVLLDDRLKNILTLTLCYQVSTQDKGDRKKFTVFSLALQDYLSASPNPERNAPYAINYPTWVKEHVHVELPDTDWELDTAESQHEHESLFYSYALKMEGSALDLDFEIKHLKDHVPSSSMREYWEITNEIQQDASILIYLTSDEEDDDDDEDAA
jgi:hypothetical protein